MKPCNCSLPCNRIHFSVQETSMSKLITSLKNYSKITVIFKNKSLLTQNQNQRLITVDLLSFVAGSMGLFLGMSCITLLEVFMYLFKSVWGTMNNARYKAYLSKLLGENVSNFLHTDPDMSRSHEEIVITQTTNPENPELNNLPPVTLQIKQSLTNRKLSIQIGKSGGGDAQMLILPRQQRFYAHSHRGIFSSFNSSFESPTTNSLKQSFDAF
uniref:Uncharacterized protein n=1 Tax=Panagrolaimus davidi TaxID=227884 RepID=A0A914QDH0_9BILA